VPTCAVVGGLEELEVAVGCRFGMFGGKRELEDLHGLDRHGVGGL
jgi:hypothetical protein